MSGRVGCSSFRIAAIVGATSGSTAAAPPPAGVPGDAPASRASAAHSAGRRPRPPTRLGTVVVCPWRSPPGRWSTALVRALGRWLATTSRRRVRSRFPHARPENRLRLARGRSRRWKPPVIARMRRTEPMQKPYAAAIVLKPPSPPRERLSTSRYSRAVSLRARRLPERSRRSMRTRLTRLACLVTCIGHPRSSCFGCCNDCLNSPSRHVQKRSPSSAALPRTP